MLIRRLGAPRVKISERLMAAAASTPIAHSSPWVPFRELHHWENIRGRAERNRSSSVSLSSGASCQTVRTSYMQHRRNSTTLTTRIPRRKP